MSLNKRRNRLIQKYHKIFNSHPIDIMISTDDGKTFIPLGNIPSGGYIQSGSISASKISAGRFGFKNFEITISQVISKKEFDRLKGILC